MKEALKLALDALLDIPIQYRNLIEKDAIAAVREALVQPEQEPVGFAVMERPWVGLTDEDKGDIFRKVASHDLHWSHAAEVLSIFIEAKLKQKNT